MDGAEQLIAMRRAGHMPPVIVVHVVGDERPWPRIGHADMLRLRFDADLSREDFRPLVAANVIVHVGTDHRAVLQAVCERVMQSKPVSVIGIVSDEPRIRAECIEFADGDFSWLERAIARAEEKAAWPA